MHSKATMVGKGTWNHTKSHRSEADSSTALGTDVIGQANLSPTWNGLGSQVGPSLPSDPVPPSRPQAEGGTYRTRGVFPPDEAVEDKADAKDNARVQRRCLQEEPQHKRKHLIHQPDVPME